MAFSADFGLESGMIISQGYFRVEGIDFNPVRGFASAELSIYKDKASMLADLPVVTTFRYDVKGDNFVSYFGFGKLNELNMNVTSQFYMYLKTLSEFTNVVDI